MCSARVVLIASSYAPYVGGVEQHTAAVATHLRDRGIQVEVWTVARDGSAAVREVGGVPVRDLPTPLPARNVRAVLRFTWAWPGAWWRWLSAWRSFRPHVLHVQCFGPNGLYAHALSKVTGTPLVLSSHGETDADDNDIFRKSFLVPAGLRWAVRDAGSVTGCSASVATQLRDFYGAEEVLVVPNGVDSVDVAKVQRKAGRILGVGRLERNKGFDLLLQAVAQVEAAHLVLVGEGSQRQELQTLSECLGISGRVQFLGARSQAETRRAIAEAEVVVMPSRKEAFGIVALEAWSARTPLVATSTCGPAHFVTNGVDGLLVDPSDPAALTMAIERILSAPDLARRLSDAGARTVQDYTWESVVDRYEDIYRQILA